MIPAYMVEPAYICIRLMDFLNYIPVRIDLKTRKMRCENRWLTHIVHQVIFLLSCCKLVQISYALVQLLVHFRPEKFPVVILTMLWLSLCATSTFWSYELFHKGLYETIMLFNSLEFKGGDDKVAGPLRITNVKSLVAAARRTRRHLGSLDLQELMCLLTPFAVKMFVPLYITVMAIFPHWSIFLTSTVMPSRGAEWSVGAGLCLIFEVLTAYFIESNILFLFFYELAIQVTHLASVQHVMGVMKEIIAQDDVAVTSRTLDHYLKRFNYYHVLVTIANVVFSRILFTGKLMALSCAILGTYYVLSNHDSSFVFVIFFGALSLQAIAFYTVTCQRLFGVPALMGKYQELCFTMLHKKTNKRMTPEEIKLLSYRIKVMPRIGIKDGGFRVLESEATLMFIDYYLNQVISLLLI